MLVARGLHLINISIILCYGLSSNIIWHQTKINGTKAILGNRLFKCSYSLEDIHWKSSHLELAFPMLSFCDIPLSDISEYLGKYGNYNWNETYVRTKARGYACLV